MSDIENTAEVLHQPARAALREADGLSSRRCPAPSCGKLMSEGKRSACSNRCRAELSRQRKVEALVAGLDAAIDALMVLRRKRSREV